MLQHLTLFHEKLLAIKKNSHNISENDRITAKLTFGSKTLSNVVISRQIYYKLNDNIGALVAITYRRSYGASYIKNVVINTEHDLPIIHTDSSYKPISEKKANRICFSLFLVSAPFSFYYDMFWAPILIGSLTKIGVELESSYYKRKDEQLSKKYLMNFITGSEDHDHSWKNNSITKK